MGLDITAHRQIKKLEGIERHDDAYDAGGFVAYANDDFPGRAEGVEDRGAYIGTEEHDFRAGSYSGYNNWREQLAVLAGYPADETADDRHRHSRAAFAASEGPFWELINFSDCEGVIGPVVSAKLAKDFADHQAKADAVEGPDADWFKSAYANWRKAFEMAADGGCVDFH